MITSRLQELQRNLIGFPRIKFTKYSSFLDAGIINKVMQTLPATFACRDPLGFVIFFD